MQSRREKEELEKFIQRQTETTDKIVSRLKYQKVRECVCVFFTPLFTCVCLYRNQQ